MGNPYENPWTADLDRRVAAMRADGWTLARIGAELGRSPNAVNQRLGYLKRRGAHLSRRATPEPTRTASNSTSTRGSQSYGSARDVGGVIADEGGPSEAAPVPPALPRTPAAAPARAGAGWAALLGEAALTFTALEREVVAYLTTLDDDPDWPAARDLAMLGGLLTAGAAGGAREAGATVEAVAARFRVLTRPWREDRHITNGDGRTVRAVSTVPMRMQEALAAVLRRLADG